jgi:hypothetical protein
MDITPASARTMTDTALHFARRDLAATIAVQEDMRRGGMPVAKLGRYWDDLHAVTGEIQRRQAGPVVRRCA